MKSNQWMSLLGLANRARKIISGEELSIKEVRAGRAKLVLLSADASANTMKKITDKCKSYEVPVKIVEDRHILGQAIGKEARVVVAVMDDGFAKKLVSLLD
ncbi:MULTISPECIES: YlxQ family RNA-binding protein [unclassified Bacillus (in: firmicutes)]|uniref:YlxQ family RNA-binding protein n=1 Tax=unclassified Bacillus (in: firmicutes) TaxID=185979 RepID=UPI0008E3CA1D|nr:MULTISPECIES: YlxQ family RNA-binding protein [unclassified Bacillus (in: firmicutes)]SFA73504.1 Ribosomal protein L7Ae [Bacillus sp. UNCCL13]SFQ63667.1 Ribosomal protein L7Ae [Bacillus sp. cl95]